MNKSAIVIALVSLAVLAIEPRRVAGWGAGRSVSGTTSAGGSFSRSASTSGGYGNFSHSASSSYTSPSGQTYSGSRSGSGTYGYGQASYSGNFSTSGGASGSYSGSATRSGGAYYGYHAPVYVAPACGSYGAGFGAGVVTGAVVGSAVTAAAMSSPPPPTTVYAVPAAGVYVAPAPTVVVAPTVVAATPAVAAIPIGTTVTVLPAGFASLNVNGTEYYRSGTTWYQMRVGANGVYFVVVPAP